HVGAWMPGQTLRLAAFSRHDIDVSVAGVFTAERDPLPVGREVRARSLALETGQAARQAAGPLDDPDVVCVSERDLSGADRRRSQQTRRPAVRPCGFRRWFGEHETDE